MFLLKPGVPYQVQHYTKLIYSHLAPLFLFPSDDAATGDPQRELPTELDGLESSESLPPPLSPSLPLASFVLFFSFRGGLFNIFRPFLVLN